MWYHSASRDGRSAALHAGRQVTPGSQLTGVATDAPAAVLSRASWRRSRRRPSARPQLQRRELLRRGRTVVPPQLLQVHGAGSYCGDNCYGLWAMLPHCIPCVFCFDCVHVRAVAGCAWDGDRPAPRRQGRMCRCRAMASAATGWARRRATRRRARSSSPSTVDGDVRLGRRHLQPRRPPAGVRRRDRVYLTPSASRRSSRWNTLAR